MKKTEAKLISSPQMNHEYVESFGSPSYTKACVELLLGTDSPAILEGRAQGIQSISGSGALFMGAQFLCQKLQFKTVYLSNPSWGKIIHFLTFYFSFDGESQQNYKFSQKIMSEFLLGLDLRTFGHIVIGIQKLVQSISMECSTIWKMQMMDRLFYCMHVLTIQPDAIQQHHNGFPLPIQLKFVCLLYQVTLQVYSSLFQLFFHL